jgi:prolyl-tRNA synthetase
MRGAPVRIEIGPRDVAARNAVLARRDRSGKEGKTVASLDGLASHVSALLDEVQKSLYTQARDAMRANTREFDDYAKFRAQMEGEGGGGMADIYWCGSAACETRIREETRATCRAIPLRQSGAVGRCLVCGEEAKERAFFAKAY